MTIALPAVTGPHLYQLVEAYCALGDHRTGSPVDDATRDWFAAELQRCGGRIERRPFAFDRFDAQADLRIGDRSVQAMPLYYAGAGDIVTATPHVAAIEALDSDHGTAALADAVAGAQAAGAGAVVVATLNPLGELQVPNRQPGPASGLPVVLVAGREADALRAGPLALRYAARIVPGRSDNVLATFGDITALSPIVVATPLSGWFGCAAERGTGIALALALAPRIAAKHPVLVVGSPGHELLPHIGLAALLADGLEPAPALVLHLGANVALGQRDADGGLAFIPSRAIGMRMDATRFAAVRPCLAPLVVEPRLDPPRWVGEGALWARATAAPLISFVGIGPQFHTPADRPESTTSPELLAVAYNAIASAIDAWLAAS